MNAPEALPRRLGEALQAAGLISADQLHIALIEQEKRREALGRVLVELGFLSEATLRDALAENLGHAAIDLAQAAVDPAALALIPREMARRHCVLPLDYDAEGQRCVLAVADSHDLPGQDRLRAHLARQTGKNIALASFLSGEAEIQEAIDRYYGHTLVIDDILAELESEGLQNGKGGEREERGDFAHPIVRLIDAILTDAVKAEASDIHFEPEAGFLRIRYRQDGILRQIRALHAACWPAMAVRLKVIGGMNIAETRAPQDGRVTLVVSGRPIDFRIASQPTLHGENIVLRVLDRKKGIVPLAGLGLSAVAERLIERMLARPEGVLLLTGPTGSGKTTTLYAILNRLNDEGVHIMTLEDPVEYPLPLIRQTSLNDTLRMDFADGVRAMLRQDPDIMLIGEVRDAATASMAFRAAMTGHRVFATLHSNSTLASLPRLADLGIGAETLAGNMAGIIAQRLIRRLCPHCKREAPASREELRLLGADEEEALVLFHPAGCARCRFTGYRGRLPIVEILRIDDELDALIARRAPLDELRRHARQNGLVSLREDGAEKVRAGLSALEELARVVDLSERM
ncbi:MAG: Flp pilus assembly complex ATPase component TadA [Zoogloeaceae bacterium]|jgi:general secretion pathway protein E/type IV pilus assembly protein PilB|nr:Flp pilus assembly complex ATPase component TadA [Zoogloeaceae bacterium]